MMHKLYIYQVLNEGKKLIRHSSSSLEAYVLGDSEWEIKMQNETECVQDFVLDSVV